MSILDAIRKEVDCIVSAFVGLTPPATASRDELTDEGARIVARRFALLTAQLDRVEGLLRIAVAVEPKPVSIRQNVTLQQAVRDFADASSFDLERAKWWTKENLTKLVDVRLRDAAGPDRIGVTMLHRAADIVSRIGTFEPHPANLAEFDRAMSDLGATDEMKLQAMQEIYNRAKLEHEGKPVRARPKPGERWLTPENTIVIATDEERTHDGKPHLVMRDPASGGTSFALFPLRTSDGHRARGWLFEGYSAQGWETSIGLPMAKH